MIKISHCFSAESNKVSVKEPRRRHAKRLSELLGADEQIQSRLCFISCSWRLNCEIKVNNSVPSVRGRADFIRLRNISAIIVSSAAQQVENSECLNDVLFFFFFREGEKTGTGNSAACSRSDGKM